MQGAGFVKQEILPAGLRVKELRHDAQQHDQVRLLGYHQVVHLCLAVILIDVRDPRLALVSGQVDFLQTQILVVLGDKAVRPGDRQVEGLPLGAEFLDQVRQVVPAGQIRPGPKQVASASVEDLKNPNILARLVGAPLTIVGRAAGVVGRTGGAICNVAGNGVEEVGDELSNFLVETFTLHPGRGVASLGNSAVTILKGAFDVTKVAVSGIFGVVYEVGDEIVYVIVPSLSNSSSLNPNEELTIVF